MPDAAHPATTAATVAAPSIAPRLLKVLGIAFGLAIIVGNTIGSGILRTPGDVAARPPSGAWFLGGWAARGEYAGFVIGWTDWISCAAAVAAGSIAIGELSGALVPALAPYGAVIAIGVTLAFTGVHWIGVRAGDLSQQALSVLKTAALLAVAVACFVAPGTPASSAATPTFPSGFLVLSALVLALQSVLYTYDGWNGVVYFGGEIRNPGREIPRAMAWGVVTVAVVYLALNGAFLHVLGIGQLAGEKVAAAAAARSGVGG